MSDPVRSMLVYLDIAATSVEKRQRPGRDRFLILAGAAACHAGFVDIADRCREIVLADNPRHLLRQFRTFAEALRDADFPALVKQLTRLCPPEQAEHLLQSQQPDQGGASPSDDGTAIADRAEILMSRIVAGG